MDAGRGDLEGPTLKQLLAVVVDLIMPYKVGRLTRSLADYSEMIDRLDSAGASFASVAHPGSARGKRASRW